MPDRYDKAVCAPELKLLDRICNQIRNRWRPPHAFQAGVSNVPDLDRPALKSDIDSDASATSAASQVENGRVRDISNLNDS